MNNVIPPPLKSGDTIGVFAPSSWVEQDDIEKSAAFLKERGYVVYVHPQTLMREYQFAGSLKDKLSAFYDLWDNPAIKCIWAAGGGNRALHLIEQIDFTKIKTAPKPIIGFSDVTALLNAQYAHNGIAGYHGPTFNRLWRCPQADQALALLQGKNAESSPPMKQARILKEGTAKGRLIGGNLSLFHYLPHTLPGHFWSSGILFIEDCNEELSRIDRMLLQLKRTGVLGEISGLICGQFSPLIDSGKPYGMDFEDIINEHTHNLDIPVIINAPFGHGQNLYTLPLGMNGTLNTLNNKATLTFE